MPPVALASNKAFGLRSFNNFWLDWRDGCLASPRFQSWAARFPLTRFMARREARALFDLCAGFVYAQVLASCIELDLFETLARQPTSAAVLAARHRIPVAAMLMLLNAAVSLRLLSRQGEAFRLGPLGAALRGNLGISAMVAHHRMFYADLADPVALLRGQAETQLGQFWPYRGSAGQSAAYSALMAVSQPMVAREILAAYRFNGHRVLMDVGGGDGSFLRLLAPHAPDLQLRLFDLPPVAEAATLAFERDHLSGRAQVYGGDFARDELPKGADIMTLIRVLHDHPDERALQILKSVRSALPPKGVLLLAEPMAGTKGAEPVGDAYFGFYLLAMGSGRARRPAEIHAMLAEAGFSKVRQIPTSQPMLTCLIIAHAIT
ncbi:MAG: methyltransferase [Rhodospirillales bacterium 20-64-7]|nr:MAG: methyltransferase [Rhodospirillales bacterium 20-64-7]